jgi:flavodoxin I
MDMGTIGLFYGSTTGNTRDAAEQIKTALGEGVVSLQNIATAKAEIMDAFDILIFGTSTWGFGDMQDDWASFQPELRTVDWTGKRVALFGLGDQYGYGDTFVDAMGLLYEAVVAQGGQIVGTWAGQDYEFESSCAHRDGSFVGLALDAENQPNLTASRIQQWVEVIRGELGL